MPLPDDPDVNPRKVRAGLAIICAVVVAAAGLGVVIDAPAGKALMFAVAATAFVRAFLLYRWLRRTEADRRG